MELSTKLTQPQRRLGARAGPVCTALMVGGVLGLFSHLFRGPCFSTSLDRWLKWGARICAGLAVLFCLLCHFVSPGVAEPGCAAVPLGTLPRETEEESSCDDTSPLDERDETQRVRWRGRGRGRWRQKWCRECKLWRPKGSGHCGACGVCVLSLDHHCIWMGTCVGERNLRFFAAFLFFAGAGCLLLATVGLHRIAQLGCFGVQATVPASCTDGVGKYFDFLQSLDVDENQFRKSHQQHLNSHDLPASTSAGSAAASTGFSKCRSEHTEALLLLSVLALSGPSSVFCGGLTLFCGGLTYAVLAFAGVDLNQLFESFKLDTDEEQAQAPGERAGVRRALAAAVRKVWSHLKRCRGLRHLCCGPLECRPDCQRREGRAPRAPRRTALRPRAVSSCERRDELEQGQDRVAEEEEADEEGERVAEEKRQLLGLEVPPSCLGAPT